MTIKNKLLTAAFALMLFSGIAEATPFRSVTLHGHIKEGVDVTGVFGFAGQDLTGMEYTQTLIGSIDPYNYHRHFIETYDLEFTGLGYAPVFDNVIVGGHARSFVMETPWSMQAVMAGLSMGGLGTSASAFVADGWLMVGNWAQTVVPELSFVPSLSFNQHFSAWLDDSANYDIWDRRVGDASFDLKGSSTASFHGLADSLTVSVIDLPYPTQLPPDGIVPEPASIALIGVGLASLILRRLARHKGK